MTNNLFKVNEDGIITMDSSEIKKSFEEAYKQAFGEDIKLSATDIFGIMANADTNLLEYAQEQVVEAVNNFNVYYASGNALDIVGAYWGYYRKGASYTLVSATISGRNGIIIPAGSKVSNGTNNFILLDEVVIGPSGKSQALFQCESIGSIPCYANTLNQIIDVKDGWDSVNNVSDGIIGYEGENDNEFRQRITANWLNIRSVSLLGSVIDNIAQLDGVVSVVGRENKDSIQKNIDGIEMPPHSIFLSVLGGNSEQIAKVITERKTIGCNTFGNTQIFYYDTNVDYQYSYKIYRPEFIDLSIKIQYEKNFFTPVDIENKIKKLIMEYVKNNPFKNGQTVSGHKLSEALSDFELISLLSIKVSKDGSDYFEYIPFPLTQVATLSVNNITVELVE